MSNQKGYVVINTSTLQLLHAPLPLMTQSQALAYAQQLGGNAAAVEFCGLSHDYDPQTGHQQTWLYNTTTKVLVRQ